MAMTPEGRKALAERLQKGKREAQERREREAAERQAQAAAPAPETTTLSFLKSFFTTFAALIRPASTTIAVPC